LFKLFTNKLPRNPILELKPNSNSRPAVIGPEGLADFYTTPV
jgi:hypothetical protein